MHKRLIELIDCNVNKSVWNAKKCKNAEKSKRPCEECPNTFKGTWIIKHRSSENTFGPGRRQKLVSGLEVCKARDYINYNWYYLFRLG